MTQTLQVREGSATRWKAVGRLEEIVGDGFDVQKLVENFEVLASASGGVDRLRGLVLELAIRGAVSNQRASDEPADALLARIRRTQAAAASAGEIDRLPSLSTLRPEELPHPLPPGWAWTRLLGAVLRIQIGPFGSLLHQSDYVRDGTPLVNPAHIRQGRIVPEVKKGVAPKTLARLSGYLLRRGDVVMGRRGEMGKCAVVSAAEDGWLCGTGSLFMRPTAEVDPNFIALWLRSPSVRRRLEGESVGSTMNNLNLRILNNLPLALPPLAEQKRIVARADQLMTLCDELEEGQTKKREVGTRLTKSALEALTTAEGPEEFDAAWKRVVENFGVIIDRAEKVDSVRTLILHLASIGRLHGGPSSGVESREGLPPLPEGWTWKRVDEVADVKLGKMRSPESHAGSHMRPYLRVANVLEGRIDTTDVKSMNFSPEEVVKFELRPGDLLLNEGQSIEFVGRPAIYRGEVPGACFQKTLIRLRMKSLVDVEFALIVFRAYMRIGRFRTAGVQTTNMAHLPLMRLVGIEFPVPPLIEQGRIVTIVRHFMQVCDDLEDRLRRAEDRASSLVEAVVRELVA